jgi:hypothetical protein
MKKGLILCLLVGMASFSVAQQGLSRNAFFVEGLGLGSFYSLNYERSYYVGEYLRLGSRIGIAPWGADNNYTINLPLSLHLIYGRDLHRAEVGAGLAWQFYSGISQGAVIAPSWKKIDQARYSLYLGYRYQPQTGGFLFRLGYQPFLNGMAENAGYIREGFVHWAGVSVGYALPYFRSRPQSHDN